MNRICHTQTGSSNERLGRFPHSRNGSYYIPPSYCTFSVVHLPNSTLTTSIIHVDQIISRFLRFAFRPQFANHLMIKFTTYMHLLLHIYIKYTVYVRSLLTLLTSIVVDLLHVANMLLLLVTALSLTKSKVRKDKLINFFATFFLHSIFNSKTYLCTHILSTLNKSYVRSRWFFVFVFVFVFAFLFSKITIAIASSKIVITAKVGKPWKSKRFLYFHNNLLRYKFRFIV